MLVSDYRSQQEPGFRTRQARKSLEKLATTDKTALMVSMESAGKMRSR
jgi:hypothetical protein